MYIASSEVKSWLLCDYTLFHCAEDDVVQDFLWVDSCAKVADKVCILWS